MEKMENSVDWQQVENGKATRQEDIKDEAQ
jgi:hypothetical protein